jgi:hypothetical protein
MSKYFDYEVSAKFSMPIGDLEYLIALSQSHYDLTCKRAGRPGPDGFLHGMKTRAEFEQSNLAQGQLTSREVNIVCKILEMPNRRPDMVAAFERIFHGIIEESNRVNGEDEEGPTPSLL